MDAVLRTAAAEPAVPGPVRGRGVLLLHPEPEACPRLALPAGWRVHSLARPEAALGIAERGEQVWLVHAALAGRVAPNGPALLVCPPGAVHEPLDEAYLGRLPEAALQDPMLAILLPQVLARWEAERALEAERERTDFQRWHDPGTALPNPLLFREHLHRLVARARRLGIDLALLQIDLVGLRRGVPEGARLRAVAAALRRAGGVSNAAGRGDVCDLQLAVSDLPPDARAEARLLQLTERVVRALRAAWPGASGRVRIGVARLSQHAVLAGDADDLERAAMEARREAWRAGRSWVLAERIEPGTESQRCELLVEQLTEHRSLPHLQAIVDLRRDTVRAAELLLRFDAGDGPPRAPACALHLLDDAELLCEVGRRVRAQALAWLQVHPRHPEVAVNLAPCELGPALLRELASVPPALRARMTLELTEGALDGQLSQVRVLDALARMGVALAVDDFGTGHAALARLRHGCFRELKLDRCFVDGVVGSAVDRAIAASVRALGAELGLSVIAEGVETEAQRTALADLGYRIGQGYLFGRPEPAVLFRARGLAAHLLPARLHSAP